MNIVFDSFADHRSPLTRQQYGDEVVVYGVLENADKVSILHNHEMNDEILKLLEKRRIKISEVACLCTFYPGKKVECHNLYVAPVYRRKQLASKMYDWIEQTFDETPKPACHQSALGSAFWEGRVKQKGIIPELVLAEPEKCGPKRKKIS